MISRRTVLWLLAGVLCAVIVLLVTTPTGYVLYPRGKAQLTQEVRGNLSVRFWYPQFGRPSVDALISAFHDELIAGVSEGEAGHEGEGSGLLVGYQVVYRTWRTVSVVFRVTIGSSAVLSAAPQTGDTEVSYVVARTYDLWDDTTLSLDAAAGHAGAAEDLKAVVLQELSTVDGVDQKLVSRGIGAGGEHLNNWVIDGSDIVVYLNPGQVALRSHGIIEVRVPLDAIR